MTMNRVSNMIAAETWPPADLAHVTYLTAFPLLVLFGLIWCCLVLFGPKINFSLTVNLASATMAQVRHCAPAVLGTFVACLFCKSLYINQLRSRRVMAPRLL